jgi:hypothetical protein
VAVPTGIGATSARFQGLKWGIAVKLIFRRERVMEHFDQFFTGLPKKACFLFKVFTLALPLRN